MQQLGWLSIGTTVLWNTGNILSENNPIGDLLHNLFGYAEAPTLLQSIFYLVYLLIAGGIFYRMTRKSHSTRPAGEANTLASRA
jgi:high-affinity Fe2+/Pb2+ permease